MSMDADADGDSAAIHIRDVLSPRRWTLWQQRPRLIAYVAFVELIVGVSTTRAAITPVALRDVVIFGALAGMGVLQAELGRRVERMRRLMSGTPHVNLTSVWTFAGVLLLPPALVTALVAILYAHLATRSLYRIRRVPPFRTIFNAALVVISCHSTAAALPHLGIADMHGDLDSGWRGIGAVALAVGVYFLVESVIVIPGLTITSWSWTAILGGWGDNLLEI